MCLPTQDGRCTKVRSGNSNASSFVLLSQVLLKIRLIELIIENADVFISKVGFDTEFKREREDDQHSSNRPAHPIRLPAKLNLGQRLGAG